MVPRTTDHHLQRPRPPSRTASNSKASFLSPSPSFEGDDEQSHGDASDDMDSDDDHSTTLPRLPTYPGEDVRPTSEKELRGWYSYGWASEVFVVCGVGSFIPITLEQLAREVGVLLKDHRTPCTAQVSPPGMERAASVLGRAPLADKAHCVVKIWGTEINTASFAMYSFSLSVLFQALVIVSMSGAADHGRYRKKLLLAFAAVGALTTMLFLAVVPSIFLIAGLLAIVANTCYGASYVLLNSFLPLLVRRHPSIPQDDDPPPDHDPLEREREIPGMSDSTSQLLPSQPPSTNITPPTKQSSPELQLSTKISAYGIGIGYIAAVTVQILGIIVLFTLGSSLFALRLVLFIIGLWWAVFTIPAALFLRPRPGPPLAAHRSTSWTIYFSHSWKLLGRTILQARRLKDVAIFLAAWFLLSDALATVSSTAILFAKTDLLMAPPALAFISVIATLFGVCGAFAWSALSRHLDLTPIQTLGLIIGLFELIPLYGLLGFIPAIQSLGVFGLQQDWEMYVLGAVYGLVLGGVGAYCRSLFGELIPPGSEAAFYALYAITDKGSSIFGPAIVGAITDHFGEIRPAFVFLAILVGLPLPLLMLVDLGRGRAEGRRLVATEGPLGAPALTGFAPVSVVVSDDDGREEERLVIAGDRQLIEV